MPPPQKEGEDAHSERDKETTFRPYPRLSPFLTRGVPAQNIRLSRLQEEYDRQKKAGTLPPDVDRLLTEDIKTGAV